MSRWLFITAILIALVLPALSANAFAVSPGMIEMEGSRADVVSNTITVINDAEQSKTFYLRSLKFTANEESGSPTFIPFDEDHAGLPEWFIFPRTRIEVLARSKVEIPFSIAIPSDAVSGGHYAAVVISESPYEVVSSGKSSISAQTAILIFLTVLGETTEQAAILDFTLDRAEKTELSGLFSYRIQNQGNVHVIPQGTITFRNALGMIVGKVDANETDGRILPSTTRTYEGEWTIVQDGSFWTRLSDQVRTLAFGPITATLELTYGSTGMILSSDTTVLYWPVELAFVLAGAIVVFILLSVLIRTSLKKR